MNIRSEQKFIRQTGFHKTFCSLASERLGKNKNKNSSELTSLQIAGSCFQFAFFFASVVLLLTSGCEPAPLYLQDPVLPVPATAVVRSRCHLYPPSPLNHREKLPEP